MTSSDVLDTSFNIQLVQSGKIILKDIDQILKVLKKQAKKYKMTPCMGRSHGIHAEPVTFGLKLASFYEEFKRNKKRLKDEIDEYRLVQYRVQLELLQILILTLRDMLQKNLI